MRKSLRKYLLSTIGSATVIGCIGATITTFASTSFNGDAKSDSVDGLIYPRPQKITQQKTSNLVDKDSDELTYTETDLMKYIENDFEKMEKNVGFTDFSDDYLEHSVPFEYSGTPHPCSLDYSSSDSDSESSSTGIYRLCSEDIEYRFIDEAHTEIEISIKNNDMVAPKIHVPEQLMVEGRNCSVVAIARRGFYKTKGLKEIVLPKSTRSIGLEAFAECPVLQRVIVKGNNIVVGVMAFYQCPSLVCVKFCGEVNRISDDAFRDCSQLKNVLLMKNVYILGDGVFDNCVGPIFIYYYGDFYPYSEDKLSDDIVYEIHTLKNYAGDDFAWHSVRKILDPIIF